MTIAKPLLLPFGDHTPKVHDTAFVAPGAVLIGQVEVGPEASIWYGCVLRGDTNAIKIGARSNVQDGTIIHVDAPDHDGLPVVVGEDVLIGHRCMIHGATVEDGGFVGMGATMLDGSRVCTDGFLAAGAFLAPGKTVAAGEMWAGLPARKLRDLRAGENAAARLGAAHYVEAAKAHAGAVAAFRNASDT